MKRLIAPFAGLLCLSALAPGAVAQPRERASMATPGVRIELAEDAEGGVVKVREDVRVGPDKTLTGSVVVLGADAVIEGRVEEDVVVLGGSARVLGSVGGDVVVLGRRAELGPKAEVRGEFVTLGAEVQRAPDARVRGRTVTVRALGAGLLGSLASLASLAALLVLWFKLLSAAGWLVLAALAGVFAPRALEHGSRALSERPLPSLLLGAAVWPAAAVALAALAFSILGLPLVPLLLLALAAACIWGYLTAGEWLGRKVLPARSRGGWLPCFAGVGILQVLLWVPVFGKLASAAALLGGLGAFLLVGTGGRR